MANPQDNAQVTEEAISVDPAVTVERLWNTAEWYRKWAQIGSFVCAGLSLVVLFVLNRTWLTVAVTHADGESYMASYSGSAAYAIESSWATMNGVPSVVLSHALASLLLALAVMIRSRTFGFIGAYVAFQSWGLIPHISEGSHSSLNGTMLDTTLELESTSMGTSIFVLTTVLTVFLVVAGIAAPIVVRRAWRRAEVADAELANRAPSKGVLLDAASRVFERVFGYVYGTFTKARNAAQAEVPVTA